MSRRQARWAQFLTRFDFLITYRPGVQQGKANALSRRSYLAPQPGEPTFDHQKQVVLGPDRLRLLTISASKAPEDLRLLDSIRTGITSDEFAQGVLNQIISDRGSSSFSKNPRKDYNQFRWQDGLLFRNTLLYVPNSSSRLQVMQYCHDNPMAGHSGIHKTLELVSRNYWWPHL